jgi:hypothetical protein
VSPFPSSGFVWTADAGFQTFDVPNVNPTYGTEAYTSNDAGVVAGSVFLTQNPKTDPAETGVF